MRENLGELSQDLWEVVAVPKGLAAIHRGADEELHVGSLGEQSLQLGQEVDEHWFDSQDDRGGALATSQEVGNTGEDAHGGFLPDLLEGLDQHLQAAACQNLSSRHQRAITTVHSVHVRLDVGVANESEDGHLEAVAKSGS